MYRLRPLIAGWRYDGAVYWAGGRIYPWHDPAILILVGLIVACLLYGVMTNVLGWEKPSILLSSAMLPGSVCPFFHSCF